MAEQVRFCFENIFDFHALVLFLVILGACIHQTKWTGCGAVVFVPYVHHFTVNHGHNCGKPKGYVWMVVVSAKLLDLFFESLDFRLHLLLGLFVVLISERSIKNQIRL